jgi:hypothetical protein
MTDRLLDAGDIADLPNLPVRWVRAAEREHQGLPAARRRAGVPYSGKEGRS